MGSLTWTPAITDDPGLNRSLSDLSSKLAGVDALLSVLSAPIVTRTTRDLKLTDEEFVDCLGTGGFNVQLAGARSRGNQRAGLVYIQNNAAAAVTISVSGRETVNGATSISLASGSSAIGLSNGAASWGVLVTVAPTLAGHVIRDNGVDQTQRSKLDFIGFTVADDSANDRTKITAPAQSTWHSRYWNQTKWNIAADVGIWGTAAFTLAVGSPALTGVDFLIAFPVTFDRAGTITDVGRFLANNGGKCWVALYDCDPATEYLPRTRLYDHEFVAPAFQSSMSQGSVGVAVTPGQVIWFALVCNTNGNSGFDIFPPTVRAQGGTDWNSAVNATPTVSGLVGYRHSFTYAQPPTTFPGSGSPTVLTSGSNTCPVFMYKFQPS